MKTKTTDRGGAATALICTPDIVLRDHLTRFLTELGVGRVLYAENAVAAERLALQELPGLLICGHDPQKNDGLALVTALQGKVWLPVILSAAHWDAELVKAAVAAGVAAFLTSYPSPAELGKALLEARARFDQEELLRTKLQDLEQRLADRKVIEKAKGLLMEREQLSEDAAFKKMRGQSMMRRISMARLAEELITKMLRPDLP